MSLMNLMIKFNFDDEISDLSFRKHQKLKNQKFSIQEYQQIIIPIKYFKHHRVSYLFWYQRSD